MQSCDILRNVLIGDVVNLLPSQNVPTQTYMTYGPTKLRNMACINYITCCSQGHDNHHNMKSNTIENDATKNWENQEKHEVIIM